MNEITDANFQKMTAKGNAVVDFYAEWCGPCQAFKPIFEKISKEVKNVGFFKVNVDTSQEAASTFEVRSIPTVVFLKNGEEIDRIVGGIYEEALKNKIKEVFR